MLKQCSFKSKKLRSITGSICLAATLAAALQPALVTAADTPAWQPKVSFEDQKNQGDLELRIHPDSPRTCGIDFIEVGTHKPGKDFDPHFALLRDRYDETFPGIVPKVRRLYPYDMKPSYRVQKVGSKAAGYRDVTVPAEIEDVLDIDAAKGQIIAGMVYDLARTIVIFAGGIIVRGLTVTVDQYIQSILKSRDYQRRRALYTLQLMRETNHPAMRGMMTPEEIDRLLAIGKEDGLTGLLLNEDFVKLAAQSQMDDRRRARIINYANLLSTINREGLVAQPLFRDFVMVYYDPKRPTAHSIDTAYTDLKASVEDKILNERSVLKNGLTPIGLYAIGDSADRLLQVDFIDNDRIGERKTVKMLADIGRQFAAAFLPFPFSWGIHATYKGAQFALNKAGKNILTDVLGTEAELAALLDSGVASLDPDLLQQVRKGMGTSTDSIFLKIEHDSSAYRVENAKRMAAMLKKKGGDLCSEIAKKRESEFRSEYMSVGESLGRGIQKIWTWLTSSPQDYNNERKRVIQERGPLVGARQLLRTYDPARAVLSNETMLPAIKILGKSGQRQDSDIIDRVIRTSVDPELSIAALDAASESRQGELIYAIIAYLRSFSFSSDQPAADGAVQALQALQKIDLSTANFPANAALDLRTELRKLAECPDPAIAELAKQVLSVQSPNILRIRMSVDSNVGGGGNG